MTPTQRWALQQLASRPRGWAGSRETGIAPNTLGALADRGLIELRPEPLPYRRLVGRITPAGAQEAARRKP